MPYKEPDATDPMMFVGTALPGGPEVTQDMAYAALCGMDAAYLKDAVLRVANVFVSGDMTKDTHPLENAQT